MLQVTPFVAKMDKCYDRNACIHLSVRAQYLDKDSGVDTLSTRNSVETSEYEEPDNAFECASRLSFVSSDVRSRPSTGVKPAKSSGELSFRGKEIRLVRESTSSKVSADTELQLLRRRLREVEEERDAALKQKHEAQTLLAEEREEKERTIDNLENAIKVEQRATQRAANELTAQQ